MTLSGLPAFVAVLGFTGTILSIYGIYLKRKSDRLTKIIDAYYDSEEAKRDVEHKAAT